MDRDDHSLSLVSASALALAPVPFDSGFGKLPQDVKTEVLAKGALMREIDTAKKAGRKILPTCKAIATRMQGRRGMSADRLSDLYYKWLSIGAAALIDHRKCGGCGMMCCTQARVRSLPDGVIRLFQQHCGTNNKQGLTESWQVLIRELCAGKIISEGLTWQTLHRDLYPGLAIPARCPWSLTNPPRGWSMASFMKHKPSRPLLDMMKHGLSAGWNHAPDVRMDTSKLRFLERVYFDDHKLDFKVLVWDRQGKVQTVEMWGLFALDASTGACIAFGLRPKILRPDGTTEGLTMRDMQHLIADILSRYGYPTAYKMTLIVENAAAAVSAYLEELLLTRTYGQVIVQRTGVHDGDMLMQGFGERWGAPRGKAPIESWFHILDIALGMVKGQTGSNWTVKPGELDGREKVARALAAVLTAHPHLAEKLSSPLHWAGEAHLIVTEAIKEINARTDHDLERHEVVLEFRWSANDPTPKPTTLTRGLPADLEREVKEYLALPDSVKDRLMQHGCTRRESPAEKVKRLHPLGKFTGIAPDTLFDLMMDTASASYRGGDVLDIEIRRGSKQKLILRFTGNTGSMNSVEIGTAVSVRFNSDKPEAGAWVFGAREQFITYLPFERDPVAHDENDLELLQRNLGRKIQAHAKLQQQARRIKGGGTHAAEATHAQLDSDIQTLTALVDTAAPTQTTAALPESANLARVVRRTKAPQAVPVQSDADAYLELVGADDEE